MPGLCGSTFTHDASGCLRWLFLTDISCVLSWLFCCYIPLTQNYKLLPGNKQAFHFFKSHLRWAMVELNKYLLANILKPHSKISFAALEEVCELVSTSSKTEGNGCSWRPGRVGVWGISLTHGLESTMGQLQPRSFGAVCWTGR